jgi:carboxyl-terminal processing protease
MQTLTKILLTSIVALLIFGLGAGAGYMLHDQWLNNRPAANESDAFALYWEVWHHVQDQFYGEVPQQTTATYGAIKGALTTLNDPYTLFIEPEPAAKEKAQLEGQFGGIGAYVHQDDQGRIVLEPMVDQPADRAGIKKGDILIAVDSKPLTTTMTIDAVIAMIRGEVGAKVTLTVERPGEAQPLDFTVERAVIETPSVQWRMLEQAPKVGYIQLSGFTERTNKELRRAIDDLSGQGAEAYILDLRNNGGGLLETAVDVASQFLREGVVLRENRKNEGEKVYNVRGGGKALDQPLVVLVNGGTASASEIVAGALQDYQRGLLLGEKTYGKGSVQLIYELSDNSRLHVTVARWFTPKNHGIDGAGLKPDIEVAPTDDDRANNRDPQLERAISYLKDGK